MNNSANCEVGAARDMPIPSTATNTGTNMIPPPIPKKLDTIPAPRLAAAATRADTVPTFALPRMFCLVAVYIATVIIKIPKST